MFARHCSDEQLLAHLDGELPLLARARVARHLERCWHCRTRRSTLESEVHSLLQKIDSVPMPPEQIARARSRFFEREELAAIDFAEHGQRDSRVRWRWMPVAAAMLFSISGFAWWRLTAPPAPSVPVAAPKPFRVSGSLAPLAKPAALPEAPLLTLPPQVQLPDAPPIDIDALELRVHYALHRAHSCLGEGIQVVRTSGYQVAVRGSVESAARREEILLRLSMLAPPSAVQVQLRTFEETRSGRLDELTPLSESPSASKGAIPIEPMLLDRSRQIHPELSAEVRQRRVIDLSNQVLRLAGVSLSHAWALHNFAVAYPPARMHKLGPADLTLAREVIDEHTAELREACSELAARLEGQVDLEMPQSVPPAHLTWQDGAAAALIQIRQLHADAFDLFSCCRPMSDTKERAVRLLRELENTRQLSAGIRADGFVAER